MLATLPDEPREAALQEIAAALADHADGAPTRKMGSVQAMLREHGGALETVRERVVALAQAELAHREQNRPAAPATDILVSKGAWYSLKEAALRLVVRTDALAERVHRHADRRRYGYPRWDGYQWWFSSLMVDPATSSAFLASMPAHEGIPELLPDWCIREGQVRAPRDAVTEEERCALRWPALTRGAE